MDHTKAYELIGSLTASIDWAERSLERIESLNGDLAAWHLKQAIEELAKANATYQQFRKDVGWDAKGEK